MHQPVNYQLVTIKYVILSFDGLIKYDRTVRVICIRCINGWILWPDYYTVPEEVLVTITLTAAPVQVFSAQGLVCFCQ